MNAIDDGLGERFYMIYEEVYELLAGHLSDEGSPDDPTSTLDVATPSIRLEIAREAMRAAMKFFAAEHQATIIADAIRKAENHEKQVYASIYAPNVEEVLKGIDPGNSDALNNIAEQLERLADAKEEPDGDEPSKPAKKIKSRDFEPAKSVPDDLAKRAASKIRK